MDATKPHQLRKEVKRLAESRDKNKAKNRVKALQIKDYQDRLREVSASRDSWKNRLKETEKTSSLLQEALRNRNQEVIDLQQERDQVLGELQELQKKTGRTA